MSFNFDRWLMVYNKCLADSWVNIIFEVINVSNQHNANTTKENVTRKRWSSIEPVMCGRY